MTADDIPRLAAGLVRWLTAVGALALAGLCRVPFLRLPRPSMRPVPPRRRSRVLLPILPRPGPVCPRAP